MNNWDTLNIGDVPAAQETIDTGFVADFTGDYNYEAIQNDKVFTGTITIATAGDQILLPNIYRSDATVKARIILPVDNRTQSVNYLTTEQGKIWIQWQNKP